MYDKMKKEWFFDKFCKELIAVYTEDGKIVEVCVEDERRDRVAVGNIYKGKVTNIVQGMQAAFVSCGMERNCYLPLDEGAAIFSKYDGEGNVSRSISIQEGDEILVQVVKPPRGNKGAKVSCDLSIVGKNLIYLPHTDFLGISRKITDESVREALLKEAAKGRREGEGFILRTAAANATRRHLKTESEYLRRVYRTVTEAALSASVGEAVYLEYSLPMKIMRDNFGDEITKLHVGNVELYEKILQLVRLRPDLSEKKISLYTGKQSLFSAYYHIEDQIYELCDTQIKLGSGAYLVVDKTEAMTVFDVNTGKYTGEQDLESTAFDTNLLAAKEIARQVRLRNIGGIIAVDFIDMAEEEHRRAVDNALTLALLQDRTKCRVTPMGDLCVTLFTRKRVTQELGSFLLKPCAHCTRQGYVLSDIYMAMRIRSAVLKLFSEGYTSVEIECNQCLAERVAAGRFFDAEFSGAWKGKRVYLLPRGDFAEERLEARGNNAAVLTLPDNAKMLY